MTATKMSKIEYDSPKIMQCPNCDFSEEIELIHKDGMNYIYICHNSKITDYGKLHADFYICKELSYEL